MSGHGVISQKTKILSTEVNCANSQAVSWKYVSVTTSFSTQRRCGEDCLGDMFKERTKHFCRYPRLVIEVTPRHLRDYYTQTNDWKGDNCSK